MLEKLKNTACNTDIKRYCTCRAIWSFIAIFLLIICMITSEQYKIFLMAIGMVFIYIVYLGYIIIMFKLKKYSEIVGVCESKNINNKVSFTSNIAVYGQSNMVIVSEDNKYIVPIPNNTEIEVGNTVKVYTLGLVYKQGDNFYNIPNPLLVKLTKI